MYFCSMNKFSSREVTFAKSKEVPFQRWYPYIEGYSPSFVEGIIQNYCSDSQLIYEPFAGTGTTLFASDNMGINTIFSEVNPVLVFLINSKISVLKMKDEERIELAEKLNNIASTIIDSIKKSKPSKELKKAYESAFGKSQYFDDKTYHKILKLKTIVEEEQEKGNNILADLLTIAILSSLLPVSFLKKQGDVRFRTEAEMVEIKSLEDVLPAKLLEMSHDVANLQIRLNKNHKMVTNNAKSIGDVELSRKISSVITSPPYLNGTNYFRNTKLELWFLGYLKKDTDLRAFRDEALTSGINDVKREYNKTILPFQSQLLDDTITLLEKKAYDSRIPLMAKSYFNEMYQLFNGLKKHLEEGANVFIDLGDSIFSNIHIKTDYILAEVIEQLGYSLKERIVLRQRRSRNGAIISQVLLIFKYKKENV